MLGSSANLRTNDVAPPRGGLRSNAPAKQTKKPDLNFTNLLELEWSELPYAMMRITAARRPWDGNRLYWRDRSVQLGDVDLKLVKNQPEDCAATYLAAYGTDELRREFTLHPSLEDGQLLWSAPGVCDAARLTTDHLAEKLLAKLVTFYAVGLPKSMTTSSASPDPSS